MEALGREFMALLTLAGVVASVAASWGVTVFSAGRSARKLDALEKELANFKVEAAQKFVTNAMLNQMEERVIEAINRLGDRLDRVMDARMARGGK